MYDDVAQEPVPDDFLDLLRQIDEAETTERRCRDAHLRPVCARPQGRQ